MLLDTWSQKVRGVPFDQDGLWSSTGTVSASLLASCLDEPYFTRAFPKSTGRELFSLNWLEKKLVAFSDLPAEDIARTLVELTAVTVTDAIQKLAPEAGELILCGGGSFNHTLVSALDSHFRGQVFTTKHLGIDPMEVEAAAFAWLASRFLQRLPGNLPAVTHAAGPRILGALYPAY
ncbi:protein belonging to Uncharacterized protein family UPF0075 [gut metagenome]|uniref:Protein belonging to Uncharacterized protein family UPF0075 n=1 Tax=gut metagenome TaxID=749906 RepID=J9GNI1_9ZZZZ